MQIIADIYHWIVHSLPTPINIVTAVFFWVLVFIIPAGIFGVLEILFDDIKYIGR